MIYYLEKSVNFYDTLPSDHPNKSKYNKLCAMDKFAIGFSYLTQRNYPKAESYIQQSFELLEEGANNSFIIDLLKGKEIKTIVIPDEYKQLKEIIAQINEMCQSQFNVIRSAISLHKRN